jgi:hypothetical protein
MAVERFDQVEYLECANGLVNRIEGKRPEEIDESDEELFRKSVVGEGAAGLAIACQVEGCTVRWGLEKGFDGTLTRAVHVGLPVCQ